MHTGNSILFLVVLHSCIVSCSRATQMEETTPSTGDDPGPFADAEAPAEPQEPTEDPDLNRDILVVHSGGAQNYEWTNDTEVFFVYREAGEEMVHLPMSNPGLHNISVIGRGDGALLVNGVPFGWDLTHGCSLRKIA